MSRDSVLRAGNLLGQRKVADFRPKPLAEQVAALEKLDAATIVLPADYEDSPAVAPGTAPGHNAEASATGGSTIMSRVKCGFDGTNVSIITDDENIKRRFERATVRVGLEDGAPVIRMYSDQSGNRWSGYSQSTPELKRIQWGAGKLRLGKRFPRWGITAAESAVSVSEGELKITMPKVAYLRTPRRYKPRSGDPQNPSRAKRRMKESGQLTTQTAEVTTPQPEPVRLPSVDEIREAIRLLNSAAETGELELHVDSGRLRATLVLGG